MVEFADGSVLAQMSNPDMRLPIQYALTYPGRTASRVKELSLTKIGHLDFAKPDFSRFPCLKLALKAGNSGGTAPAVMNAANEIAVNAFLQNRISFDKIASVVEKTMKSCGLKRTPSLEHILEADATARRKAEEIVEKI
jgi:1-deoxy-D-xylulose-5-phosphate reductoisomerase